MVRYSSKLGPKKVFFYKKELPNGCWEFTGTKTQAGYGMIWFDGRSRLAHRLAYIAINGPTNKDILHSCDYPPCINPAHLFEGDDAINMLDMAAKGRFTKITFAVAEEIRTKFDGVYGRIAALGREYGISPSMVKFIITNERWRKEDYLP